MLIFEMTAEGRRRGIDPSFLGSLPSMMSALDPRPAVQQINDLYPWFSHKGFKMLPAGILHYPGDPDMPPLFMAQLRDEVIYLYEYSWVAIVDRAGDFDVARMN